MGTVQRRGVPDDVIVDMLFVDMSGHDEGVLAFQKPGCKFIAHLVCFLRGDLSGLKGLPHLIGDHVAFLLPPGDAFVLPLGKKKLRICCVRVTGISGNKLTFGGLLRFFRIVRAVGETLSNGLALVDVHGDNAGRRHAVNSFPNKQTARGFALASSFYPDYLLVYDYGVWHDC